MDKPRYDNRSDQWRKQRGAQRARARFLAGVPKRLVFVTLATMAAYATQFILQRSENTPDLHVSDWIAPRPEAITGVTSVIDGDTIEVHGQRIRFNGIDAPEAAQQCDDAKGVRYRCGAKAAAALDGFLAASRPVTCTFVAWDRHNRFVGDCRRADGASAAAWMVEHGHALDWPKFSHGAYAEQQAKAEATKVGLWVGKFQAPWDWRAGRGDNARPAVSQALGIISSEQVAQSYSCQPRRKCSQISSCDEAQWYLSNCPWGVKLDRDGNGVACETLC